MSFACLARQGEELRGKWGGGEWGIALMSGFYTMVLTFGLTVGFLLQPGGVEKFTWIYDNWIPLTSAALAMSVIQATWVYAYSYFSGELLALGGNSGNFIYDVCPLSLMSIHRVKHVSQELIRSGLWVDRSTPPSRGSQTLTSRLSTRFDRELSDGTCSTFRALVSSTSGQAGLPIR